MPERNEDIFLTVLKTLQDSGVLDDMVLVGSWCLLFYKQLFKNDPLLPEIRTLSQHNKWASYF